MIDKIVSVHKLANELMHHYGLIEKGWTFELSNTKNVVGDCHYATKQIRYSMHFLAKTPDHEVRDTILHEIAHALSPSDKGHGVIWRAWAIKVGAKPERCATSPEVETTAKPNYVIKCENPHCPVKPEWHRYRLRRSMTGARCPDCNTSVHIYQIREG